MAARIGVGADELLDVLRRWKSEGRLRRIGAVVNHFKAGLGAGALVAWKVEPGRVAEAGRILASFRQASHVYERRPAANWPYNLYAMVHASDLAELEKTAGRMSAACNVAHYRLLVTERELKKTPPKYVDQ
jgi:DNA-binding Lrp family transcriptional regulator